MKTFEHEKEFEIERNNNDIEITVTFEIEPLIPGKYYGPPENCYPDEGGCASVVKVINNDTKESIDLTDKEEQDFCESAYEEWEAEREEEIADRMADRDDYDE